MYVVLTDETDRLFCFSGKEPNPRAVGPFISSKEALEAAGGDSTRVVSVYGISGVTDRYFWRDIVITPVYDL
jgi:hypothetical protein